MKARFIKSISGVALTALIVTTSWCQGGQVAVSTFDSPDDVSTWLWESWSAEALVEHDTTRDAGGGGPGSGSLRVINNFPDNPTGYGQAVITGPLAGQVDAETLYTNISFDVKLDPSSYPRVNGTQYGTIELNLRNGSTWEWNRVGGVELTSSHTNWTRLTFPVKAPANAVHRLTLKLGQNNLTNTVIYNIDNISWEEATGAVPPPVMSIEKTTPGLNLVASSAGQYDRQSLATTANSYDWIGASEPMSYSMTIKEFPSAVSYPGFSTRLYLVPGTPGTADAPDWNEPSVIYVDIFADTNGGGTAMFHYKTNAPGSNGAPTSNGSSQYFNSNPTNGPVGQLGSVTGANVLGTWTVTINQDTNITLTAPDGATNGFAMPPEDTVHFGGGGTAYFGIFPGQLANVGQRAIFSRLQIKSGATTLIDENFSTSPLNPDLWVVRAASQAGVNLITPQDPLYVSWTTPASGFTLQTNADLALPNWGNVGLTDQLVGTKRRVLVPSSVLPALNKGFFRLAKPTE